jgi:hypothetical protein
VKLHLCPYEEAEAEAGAEAGAGAGGCRNARHVQAVRCLPNQSTMTMLAKLPVASV